MIIILGFIAIAFIFFSLYSTYVSLIMKKNKVREAFSSIDVQLKKRYDLMPNILTIAEKFMEHEKSLMEDITKLRTNALSVPSNYENIGQKLDLDAQIRSKMQQLMVSVENYPQLKSDQAMINAMQTYNEVEEHVAAARRFFNSAVNDLNNAVEIFPSSLIAAMLGIKARDYFKAEDHEAKPVNAADYLGK